MLKSSLRTVIRQEADAVIIAADRNNKQIIFKNFSLFPDCIREIKNTKSNNIKDANANVVMSMYNLTECSDNYSKAPESLWRYVRYEPDDNKQILNHLNLKSD